MNYFVYPGLRKEKGDPQTIIEIVSEITKVPLDKFTKRTRKREIVYAKALAAHIMRTNLRTAAGDPIPYKLIGKHLDGRDHTLARHLIVNVHEPMYDTEEQYRNNVKQAQQHYDRRFKFVTSRA